jgi:hypothetical protein
MDLTHPAMSMYIDLQKWGVSYLHNE